MHWYEPDLGLDIGAGSGSRLGPGSRSGVRPGIGTGLGLGPDLSAGSGSRSGVRPGFGTGPGLGPDIGAGSGSRLRHRPGLRPGPSHALSCTWFWTSVQGVREGAKVLQCSQLTMSITSYCFVTMYLATT